MRSLPPLRILLLFFAALTIWHRPVGASENYSLSKKSIAAPAGRAAAPTPQRAITAVSSGIVADFSFLPSTLHYWYRTFSALLFPPTRPACRSIWSPQPLAQIWIYMFVMARTSSWTISAI